MYLSTFCSKSVHAADNTLINLMFIGLCIIVTVENKRPTWCHLLFLFHFLGAQHVSDFNISIIRSLRLFCWITTLVVLFLVRCVLVFQCGWVGVVSVLQAEAPYHANPTTPKHQHTSNQEHMTNVVIQQNSLKLLMTDILMSESCWAHKKWNKYEYNKWHQVGLLFSNILMIWGLLAWYNTLGHVSNTLIIITLLKIVQNRVCISFPKIGSHLKIIGARRATCSKIHGEDPQILGPHVQVLVAMSTFCTYAAGFATELSTFSSTALLCVATYRNCPHETVFILCVSGQSEIARKRHGKSATVTIKCLITSF